MLELKRSSVSIGEGIRQNLDNQKKQFIRPFFTTMQLVMAGNDTQGLRYANIETPEKYYLQWKEAAENPFGSDLDWHLSLLCHKARFLELIHNFIVFDAGTKKTCRHNQYFGIQAAQQRVQQREGGIIWHPGIGQKPDHGVAGQMAARKRHRCASADRYRPHRAG